MVRIAKNEEFKTDTKWYDDLVVLFHKTGIESIRNVLWDQVKGLVYGRVHDFIRQSSYLRYDNDLCQKLFQESFFIFVKAVDIWDVTRKTKFITFLGAMLDQEIKNIIRLEHYHKNRDKKIEVKIKDKTPPHNWILPSHETNLDRNEFFEEIREIIENFPFENQTERDVVFTIIYGEMGDWSKLRKRLDIGIGKLYKIRAKAIERLRIHIKENCSEKMKTVLGEVIAEK